MLEGLNLAKPTKKIRVVEEPKKMFDFGTAKRATGAVRVIDWLEDKTVDAIADLWKLGHVAKKMTDAEKQKFADIKYYLKSKYGLVSVK